MEINVWATCSAAVASFVLGGIWYSHRVFGLVWSREAGRGPEAHQPHALRVFGLSFLFALVTALGFAYWLGPAPPLLGGLQAGLLAGAAFVATSMGMTYQFAGLSIKIWLIDGGYHVARFLVYALVLGLWH